MDIQPFNANSVPSIDFSEHRKETPLDLNFSQRGTQNLANNAQQRESDGVPGTPHEVSSQKSRCHWTHGDIIALFDAKKAQTERAEHGSKKNRVSSSGKWEEIADFCKTLGVHKLASQCRDKWERLWPGFKKILDWEKQIPEGKASYWTMTEDEREREGFPRVFDKDIHDAMSARFGLATSLNLPSLIGSSLNEESETATEIFPDATAERAQNGPDILEDLPARTETHVLRSSGRKRKTPDRFGLAKSTPEGNRKATLLLEPKEEAGGGNRVLKDGQSNRSKTPSDVAERRMLLEERKLKLEEKKFSLEEKKLEITIEIGKGLIASMERMSATISSLGVMSSQQ